MATTKQYRKDVKKQIAKKGYAVTPKNRVPKTTKATTGKSAAQKARDRTLLAQERKALNMGKK